MISQTQDPELHPHAEDYHILLIEDDPAEIYLAQEAISSWAQDTGVQLHVAMDGRQALDFLQNQSSDKLRPHLILLDLHLPYVSGYDLLELIKADQALKDIPVIILTASVSDEDINQTYQLNANGYLSKPEGYEELQEVIRLFRNYWVSGKRQAAQ